MAAPLIGKALMATAPTSGLIRRPESAQISFPNRMPPVVSRAKATRSSKSTFTVPRFQKASACIVEPMVRPRNSVTVLLIDSRNVCFQVMVSTPPVVRWCRFHSCLSLNLKSQQGIAVGNLAAFGDVNRADDTLARRADGVLHLHRFDGDQRVAAGDPLPGLHGDGSDHAGQWGGDYAGRWRDPSVADLCVVGVTFGAKRACASRKLPWSKIRVMTFRMS
jgi:hypothetical protein